MRDSCHSDPRSDEELIAAANGGEVAAFEVLYHRYRDWVLRHAYRWTGNRDQALDVLQETFAYLLRKMPGFRLTSKMTSFLYPAVKHLSLRMRSEHRHLFMRDEDLPDVPDPATTDENVTRKDLTAALAGLPAAQREILFLRFVDGMRLDEIARGARGLSGQSTEIEYLHPSERSGHDVSLTLDVDAGVKVEEIESVNHAVHVDRGSRTTARVTRLARDSIPNKDFVLRYRVAGNRIKTAMMTHEDERGGFFTLMVYPPRSHQKIKRSPVEMVFVLDCSGSMHGAPLAKSKAAISRALRRLEPDDTFQIIRFSEGASHLGPVPVVATRENVERGLAHLATLESSGGTYMIEGIKAAGSASVVTLIGPSLRCCQRSSQS